MHLMGTEVMQCSPNGTENDSLLLIDSLFLSSTIADTFHQYIVHVQ